CARADYYGSGLNYW
nr:immunoglobulin heavy chain junction region [Macaca mulatta]MOW93600.1 immunoglobulin heavy chain junction region [Macaca mulatta]MOW94006.1 immunoglobulin heavy chain junction region [Macaca mulatta]MOW94038.1 immunoglobulin heavy chain junction region [Macaca mulatta]MOW94167.1 immunoglobulin heavy chain junction region [Macaca mulatta]